MFGGEVHIYYDSNIRPLSYVAPAVLDPPIKICTHCVLREGVYTCRPVPHH